MYKIYLISAINPEGHLQWKVGLSKHPDKRIKEIKTANPNKLNINATYSINERDVAYKTESLIHKFLDNFKIDGEWFESYSLNTDIFFVYCEKYEEIARILVKIEENKKWK